MNSKRDLQELKRRVGVAPFSERIRLSSDGFAPCPFHNGDGDRSFHVIAKDDGVGIATCFSECGRSWDAIDFVKKFDHVSTDEAIRRLSASDGNGQTVAEKTPVVPMTAGLWDKSGRPVTDEDVATLAASRPHSATPVAFTLNELGFRIGSKHGQNYLVAPYRLGDTFYTVKARNLSAKDFLQEKSISQKGLFNIDAVRKGCDVFVVESELDAAVLAENGYIAVSVISSTQKEIEPEVLTKLLTARRIFLVGDQDTAGQTCMNAIARLLPPEKVYRIEFAHTEKQPPPKDVGEWALEAEKNRPIFGTFVMQWEDLKLEAIKSWVAKTVPLLSDVSDTPVEWVVDRLLPFGGLLVLAGEYGSMKSLVALYMAAAIAQGSSVFNREGPKRKVPVLYLDRENPQPVVGERRKGMGIPPSAPIYYWGAWVNGDEFKSGVPNLDDPRLDEFAVREKGVIVIDSLIDFLEGADENSSSEMTKVMQRIVRLARIGGGVIVLHHSSKQKNDVRGSTAIAAAADIAVVVSKTDGEESTIQLKTEKTRMCSRWTMKMKFLFGNDWGYAVKGDQSETAQREAAAAKNKAEAQQQEAETQKRIALARKFLRDYHDTHDGAGVTQGLFLQAVRSEGLTREAAERVLAAGLHRDWEIQDGARNALLYRLKGWSKAGATEASGQVALTLDLERN